MKVISLVDDWKQAWKWWSFWLVVASDTLVGLWMFVPSLKQSVDTDDFHTILIVAISLIALGRIIKQGKKEEQEDAHIDPN